MQRWKIHRATLIAAAVLILSFGTGTKGFAQANSPQPVRNIVLVHGAWADGSCWSKVIALLQAKGFHAVAVQNPLTSLADDVAGDAVSPKRSRRANRASRLKSQIERQREG